MYHSAFWVLYHAGYRWYHIPNGAMEPTIKNNEHAIGHLSAQYRYRMKRFDIAIYNPPHSPKEFWAKRVVALPGEHIRIESGGILINGIPLILPESINKHGLITQRYDVTLPDNAIFIISDNTFMELDSRTFGPLPIENVVGNFPFKK